MKTLPNVNRPLRKNLYLLIDTGALFYRAMFAMKDFSGDDLRGLIIKNIMEELFELCLSFNTNNLVFLFDSKTSLRKDIYPEYKAKRTKPTTPEEIERLRTMHKVRVEFRKRWLPLMGFNNTFVKKGLESDDLIAAITQEWLGDFVIVTSDRDLWQCLANNVRWLSVASGELVTTKSFREKTGLRCTADWVAVKTLGCISDNVKGVRGVAEPSAIKYVLGTLTGKKLRDVESEEGQKIRKRNFKLVNLPFKPLSLRCQTTHFNPDGFERLCRELGLKQLRKQKDVWEKHFLRKAMG